MTLRRAPYSPCRLYIDGVPQLAPGDYLRTRGGSAYFVTHVTPHRTRPMRRNLRCLRWPIDEIPAEAKVHPLHWYGRTAKRGRHA